MDFLNLMEFVNIAVVVLCILVGFIIKTALPKVPNRYIPVTLMVIGAVCNCIIAKDISVELITYGMFTGFASIGLYETFMHTFKYPKPDEDITKLLK